MPDTRLDAIYARQSVDRADSISIENQIAWCLAETHGRAHQIYSDRGFSGGNTNRPGFASMMEDVQKGQIRRVIVYKLDRISRSLVDFVNITESLHRNDVAFVSATERFDTASPMGRAMLGICMIFAELERETIQKRVTDAYAARCRRGFYMGGRIPYGFRLRDTVIDNIHTAMYEPMAEEAAQIREIYRLYASGDDTMQSLAARLPTHGLPHLRGGTWNSARISELLKNPIYVRADCRIRDHFIAMGTVVPEGADRFTGTNGCYLYDSAGESVLVAAPHEGLVDSDLWLACRHKAIRAHGRGISRTVR